MLKLTILSIGKTKEKWLEDAVEEYLKRLKPYVEVNCIWVKNDDQLVDLAKKEKFCIALDPGGRLMSSEDFSKFMFKSWERGGSSITMIIGGAEGLPKELKQDPLISLSPMTLTHQITRLVLIEQIYRAIEINKGTQYHK
jgi:23S rRNA (pseudouridine1915-N3)-methyltransferase